MSDDGILIRGHECEPPDHEYPAPFIKLFSIWQCRCGNRWRLVHSDWRRPKSTWRRYFMPWPRPIDLDADRSES